MLHKSVSFLGAFWFMFLSKLVEVDQLLNFIGILLID